MNIELLAQRYAEHLRRKWFPQKYQDFYGAFIDDINGDTLDALKSQSGPAAAALALAIIDLLPHVQHQELATEAEREYLRTFDSDVRPAAAFYALRASAVENRMQMWNSWKQWAESSRTPLYDWLNQRLATRSQFAEVKTCALTTFGIDSSKACNEIENALRATRDLFDFHLRRYSKAKQLPDVLGSFRLQEFDSLADWTDFPSLAKSWSLTCHIPSLPTLKVSPETPEIQQVFPIDPPERVVQRYGIAAGPVDSARFIQQLGIATFYCDMNPQLTSQERTAGDPQLPSLWSHLYGNALRDPEALTRFLRYGMEDLAPRLELIRHFWLRYDCILALYQERLASDLKQAQDLYVSCWDIGFQIEPPHFLYLQDLERANDALLRVLASRAASGIEDRLKSLYGNEWFASTRSGQRLREYRREGYRYTMMDILHDLNAEPNDQFLMIEP